MRVENKRSRVSVKNKTHEQVVQRKVHAWCQHTVSTWRFLEQPTWCGAWTYNLYRSMVWRLQACVQTAVEGGDRLRQDYEAVRGATYETSVYPTRFGEPIVRVRCAPAPFFLFLLFFFFTPNFVTHLAHVRALLSLRKIQYLREFALSQ